MTPESLLYALRLAEVKRWGIIATAREQSVAEHTYRTMLIALAIYDYMEGGVPHNSDDRNNIIQLATLHDVHEVMSGDLNTLFKRALEQAHPGVYEEALQGMARGRVGPQEMLNATARIERAMRNTIVEAVVKIADLVEAILFVSAYACDRVRGAYVIISLTNALKAYLQDCSEAHHLHRYDWARVDRVIRDILDQGARVSHHTDPAISGAPQQEPAL